MTCYNLPATSFATSSQHKLQRKLHRAALAVELDSTSCNDGRYLFRNNYKLEPPVKTGHKLFSRVKKKLVIARNFFMYYLLLHSKAADS